MKPKFKVGETVTYDRGEGNGIPFPEWASPRLSGWNYGGWISRIDTYGDTFENIVERQKRSDHGELREIDVYAEGGVIWIKEKD